MTGNGVSAKERRVGWSANAAIACAWLLWSCDPVLVRYLGEDFPRLVMLAIGSLSGGLVFLLPSGRALLQLRSSPKLLLLLACYVLFGTALADFCYVHAVKYLHPGLVSVVLRSQLLFAILAAWLFLGEHISRWTALGMFLVLGAYGRALFQAWTEAAGDHSFHGWLLAFVSALLWTFATIAGKVLLQEVKPTALAGLRLLLSGLIMLALSLRVNGWEAYRALQAAEWLLLIGKGVGISALAFGLYLYGLRTVRVAVASAWEQLAPLFTIIISALWLGEFITARQALSVAVVIFGAVLIIAARAWEEHKIQPQD